MKYVKGSDGLVNSVHHDQTAALGAGWIQIFTFFLAQSYVG